MIKPLFFLLVPLAAAVRRQLQPGGSCSGTLGQAASTGCTTATGSACSKTSPGSTAYASWSGVTYSTSTGKFSGSLVHNGCPHDTRAWSQSSVSIPWKTSATALGAPGTATCCSTSFPATGYSSTPKTVPAGGIAGISMYGEDVYGFGDNGFNSATQNLCTTGAGGCPKNSDVDTCQAFGEATCGTSNLQVSWFLSDCGGETRETTKRRGNERSYRPQHLASLSHTLTLSPLFFLCIRPCVPLALSHLSDLRPGRRHDVGVAVGVGRAQYACCRDARRPRLIRTV